MHNSNACGRLSIEEQNVIQGTGNMGFNSLFRVFYVESIDSGPRAYSYPPYCATGAASSAGKTAVVSNTAQPRTLAHEFGHILLNSATHSGIVDPAATSNIMTETNIYSGEVIDPTQCSTIFANA